MAFTFNPQNYAKMIKFSTKNFYSYFIDIKNCLLNKYFNITSTQRIIFVVVIHKLDFNFLNNSIRSSSSNFSLIILDEQSKILNTDLDEKCYFHLYFPLDDNFKLNSSSFLNNFNEKFLDGINILDKTDNYFTQLCYLHQNNESYSLLPLNERATNYLNMSLLCQNQGLNQKNTYCSFVSLKFNYFVCNCTQISFNNIFNYQLINDNITFLPNTLSKLFFCYGIGFSKVTYI